MTSTGSVAGRGIPHRYVADRCDAMPAGDAASTAAAIRCSGVSAVPGSRATPGWTASNRPDRMARFHAEPLSPEAAFVINPWWVLAHSSMSRSCIPERGCAAARTGTGGPDLTEIVLAADHGRIRVGNRTESDRDRRAPARNGGNWRERRMAGMGGIARAAGWIHASAAIALHGRVREAFRAPEHLATDVREGRPHRWVRNRTATI